MQGEVWALPRLDDTTALQRFFGGKVGWSAIFAFSMLRRVENMVDGKTNVQVLGRAAHLKLDQLGERGAVSFFAPSRIWTGTF